MIIKKIGLGNYRFDSFGNLLVWLPYGTPGKITDDKETYEVTEQILKDSTSNNTLTGIDVTLFHPENKGQRVFVSPDNKANKIGICLGRTRYKNATAEVLCKITDKNAQNLIISDKIRETSPSYYIDLLGHRVYNHIALDLADTARGGQKMTIKFESNNKRNMLTNEEVQAIATAVLGLIKADFKAESQTAEEIKAKEKEITDAAFQKGVSSSKYLVYAESLGYEGGDIEEARLRIMQSVYPDATCESMKGQDQNYVSGLIDTAMKLSAKSESKTKPMSVPDITVLNAEAASDFDGYSRYFSVKK
jgi:hypothetical protein